MTPREWLRAAAGTRWWGLPDGHVRVALALVAMSDEDGRLVTTFDDMVMVCRMPRASLWRVLAALESAGFCTKQASSGRAGETVLLITQPGTLEHSTVIDESSPPESVVERMTWNESAKRSRSESTDENCCGSASPPRFPGTFKSTDLERFQTIGPEIRPGASRASDLDLQRSSGSGSPLRSPDSQDLTRSEIKKVPPKKRRTDPLKVPPRAWAGADYLRTRVLEVNAAAFVGTKPWEGDTGLRLTWANSFRLLGDQTLKAMKNAGPATEADAWEAIARTVQWLFDGQGPSHRFVVESPDSLREKWDAIQAVRRNKQIQPAARGSDGRPDPLAERTYKRLSPGDM
jgi:hypothetical protein